MQKFALFTGSCQSITAIQYLYQHNMLACVVLVDAAPNPDLAQLQWLQQNNIVIPYRKEDDAPLLQAGYTGGKSRLSLHVQA